MPIDQPVTIPAFLVLDKPGLGTAQEVNAKREVYTVEVQSHSDDGMVLRADQAAFVVDADGKFSIFLPQLADGEEYTAHQMLVLAFAARVEDKDFIEEMMDVLRDLHAQ